jgi:transposase-like protein
VLCSVTATSLSSRVWAGQHNNPAGRAPGFWRWPHAATEDATRPLTRPDSTVSSIARLLGVSRVTIYKYVPEVTTGRQAVALPPGQE